MKNQWGVDGAYTSTRCSQSRLRHNPKGRYPLIERPGSVQTNRATSIGLPQDPVYAEFALEAKCYRPAIDDQDANTVGVKEVARLISRLRHRQFGILVTTSLISRQAYEEVRKDRHPIVFISGRDIAEILIEHGHSDPESVLRLTGD